MLPGGAACGAAGGAVDGARRSEVLHGAPPCAGRHAYYGYLYGYLYDYTMAILWLYYGYTYSVFATYFRLAQADEDRAGLTVELSTLKERLAQSEERLATLAVGGNGLPPPPSAPAPAPAPTPAASEISRGMSFKAPKLGKLSKPTLDF